MNKLERNLLKRNKFIRRIKLLKERFYSNSLCGLLEGSKTQRNYSTWMKLILDSDFNCYRTTSTPCTDKLFQLRYNKKDRVSWKRATLE